MLVVALSAIAYNSHATIKIGGVDRRVDTLVHRQIAPGAMYTRMSFPEFPMRAYMMTVDMRNEYNLMETFQAFEQAGKTEALTNGYTRLKSDDKQPIGGINGNFWIVTGQGQPTELLGVPHSGSIRNGEMVTDPNGWNRGHGAIGFAVIDTDNKVWVDDMQFDGKVQIEGVGDYTISEVNRVNQPDQLMFYNSYVGEKTRSDNSGIEVFIRPVAGQNWNVNADVLCEVTRIIKDKGANALQVGESVLSGNGAARVFLEHLSVGQQVKVNLGVYTLSDQLRPIMQQMITGNALVMKNGELTDRNTNEAYNSQLYPRTGVGVSQDGHTLYMIVIDKLAASAGATTATMCEILKAAGAHHATSLDGGGSAQMMLQGHIVNTPADGKERPVANGWMLFHTAPASDGAITKIDFADYTIRIPAHAYYTPSFLGYNEYGVLCTEQLEGVTLSCDPALGHVIDGKTFVAAETPRDGYLIATYGDIQLRKYISVQASEVALRLHSIVMDGSREYPIEVLAQSSNAVYPIDPAALTWQVEDESICRVDKGVLTGLKNGKTRISGTFEEVTDHMEVSVEIPSTDPLPLSSSSLNEWKFTSNMNTPLEVTAGQNHAMIAYKYVSARSPYIQVNAEQRLFSLPKAIRFTLNSHEAGIVRMTLTLQVNGESKTRILEWQNLERNSDNVITILTDQLLEDASDLAAYPLSLISMKISLDAATMVVGNAYTMELKDIFLCYSEQSINTISKEEVWPVCIYPNPITDGLFYLSVGNQEEATAFMQLYTLSGVKLKEFERVVSAGNHAISIGEIPSGKYVLNIQLKNTAYSYIVMIR